MMREGMQYSDPIQGLDLILTPNGRLLLLLLLLLPTSVYA